MTYGVTTTTSPATSAVIQPSQNSAPESKTISVTVVQSIPPADHSVTGKSLKADRAVSPIETKVIVKPESACLRIEINEDDPALVQSLIDAAHDAENDDAAKARLIFMALSLASKKSDYAEADATGDQAVQRTKPW